MEAQSNFHKVGIHNMREISVPRRHLYRESIMKVFLKTLANFFSRIKRVLSTSRIYSNDYDLRNLRKIHKNVLSFLNVTKRPSGVQRKKMKV